MRPILILISIFLSGGSIVAQDFIVLYNGSKIKSKVLEVGISEIKYYKFGDANKTEYKISKNDVVLIEFENGEKATFLDVPTPKKPEPGIVGYADLYAKGANDAKIYYRRYKASGTVTLISTLSYPVFGLIPAIACSITTPKMKNLDFPDPDLFRDPSYSSGYKEQAYKIKKQKVWKNFGIGFGVWFIFVGLLFVTL